MTFAMTERASVQLLDYLAAQLEVSSAEVCLYRNKHQPSTRSVLSDFRECDFSGYSRRIAEWNPAELVRGRAKVTAQDVEWRLTGLDRTNKVRGYFVVNDIGELLFAYKFSSHFNMNVLGGAFTLRPSIILW